MKHSDFSQCMELCASVKEALNYMEQSKKRSRNILNASNKKAAIIGTEELKYRLDIKLD